MVVIQQTLWLHRHQFNILNIEMQKVNSANAPYTSPFLPLLSPLFPDGVSLAKPYSTRFTTMHHEQWYCTGIVTIVMMHSVDSAPMPTAWAMNARFTSRAAYLSASFSTYCDCQMWHSSSFVSLHLRVFSTASPLNVRTCLRVRKEKIMIESWRHIKQIHIQWDM